MGITAFPGNIVVFGQATPPTGQNTNDYNTTDAPSLFNIGTMLLDPRQFYDYEPGNNYGASSNAFQVYGWLGTTNIPVIDQVPTTISTNSIAQSQAVTSSTPLTLTASNTNNVTVGVSILAPESGQTVSVLAIDGAMGTVTFGSDASIAAWDPTKAISRCITITTTGNDLGGFWSIAGRDIYGYKITEAISASSSASTYTSKKAYKYIQAITPTTTGTFGSTSVIVGVSDTYGLPLFASNGAYVRVFTNNALVVSSTNITAGQSLSSTATSTTADVRGTYASSTASNGTVRTVMFITPSVAGAATNIGYQAGAGSFGISQYSSI